jgi:hypothetical protein
MKWTQINESMIQDRESEFTSDMSDLYASFAISEAISFAAEGKYIAEGLFRDILSFNKKAEDMNYSVEEYISEAFSVSGIFEKILNFIKKVRDDSKKFLKNLTILSQTFFMKFNIFSNIPLTEKASDMYSSTE